MLAARARLLPPELRARPTLYTIQIHGHLGAMVLSEFPAMDSRHQGGDTVVTGRLDRSALYGVQGEIETLGLELLEVRQQTPGRDGLRDR